MTIAGSGKLERLETAVDLARDRRRLLVAGELDLRGERRLRPAEQLGEHLADGVRVVVDRLLAHEDEVGLLGLDDLREHARDARAARACSSVMTRMARSAPIARPVRSCSCATFAPIAHQHDLAAGDLLLDAQRLLDGDLVEGVDHPLDVVGDDAGAVGLHLDAVSGSGTRLTVTRIFTSGLSFGCAGKRRHLTRCEKITVKAAFANVVYSAASAARVRCRSRVEAEARRELAARPSTTSGAISFCMRSAGQAVRRGR